MNRLLYFLLIFICIDVSARDWDVIKESGVLKVGVRNSSQLVYAPNDKEHPGFVYEMVRDFASQHGLKLELLIAPRFASYWTKGDEFLLKTNTITTPDIYQKIDVAAEIFTVNEQRRKLVHLSPYIDNVELFYGVQGLKIKSYEELLGKRVLAYESMSFLKIITDELKMRKIPFEITYIELQKDRIKTPEGHQDKADKVNLYVFPPGTRPSGTDSYHPVALKDVDLGVNDGVAVIYRIFGNSFFQNNLRPLFPARKQHSQLAWGSTKNDKKLNQKIADFIEKDRSSGAFSKRLQKYLGMSLDEYQQIIGMIK